jgi:glycosyl-4,4'-diaponeurosporenoate acyltransferase
MVVSIPWTAAVVVDALAWTLWSVTVGALMARRPEVSFRHDGPVLRLRAFEIDGAWYERVWRVRSWKRLLPEAGNVFGGRSKRRLPALGREGVRAFLAECRRGERVHWWLLAATPLFALWNPPGLFVAMVAFAVVANIPCVVVLRYNRARILRRQASWA